MEEKHLLYGKQTTSEKDDENQVEIWNETNLYEKKSKSFQELKIYLEERKKQDMIYSH